MDGMLALTIVCVIFAIGDFISDRTHAVIPVLLFASISFLILFWTRCCSDNAVHRTLA